MGHNASSPSEFDDLSFEKGRRIFLRDVELRSGRSNNSISCMLLHVSVGEKIEQSKEQNQAGNLNEYSSKA